MRAVQRPVSTTIISWLSIIGGLLSVVSTPLGYMFLTSQAFQDEVNKNPELKKAMADVPKIGIGDVVIGILLAIVYVIAGSFMLKGQNWARWTFVVALVVGVASSAVQSPNVVNALPTVFFSLILGLLLFKSSANAYFSAGPAEESDGFYK